MPSREMYLVTRTLDGRGHRRKRVFPVDQHLDAVAFADGTSRRKAAVPGRFQRVTPIKPAQASRVVSAQRILQPAPESFVEYAHDRSYHCSGFPNPQPSGAPTNRFVLTLDVWCHGCRMFEGR
jgi:hypothetical protein